MRLFALALVLGVVATSRADVQCFLSVRSATARESRTTWQTSWGSYQKEKSQRKSVRVELRNTSKFVVDFEVKVYFVSEGLDGKGSDIYSVKSTKVSLGTSEMWDGVIISDTLDSTDDRYRALGIRKKTGGRYDGWVLVLYGNGETVRIVDSKKNPRYRDRILKLVENQKD